MNAEVKSLRRYFQFSIVIFISLILLRFFSSNQGLGSQAYFIYSCLFILLSLPLIYQLIKLQKLHIFEYYTLPVLVVAFLLSIFSIVQINRQASFIENQYLLDLSYLLILLVVSYLWIKHKLLHNFEKHLNQQIGVDEARFENIKSGDSVKVKAGDVIPFHAKIEEGEAVICTPHKFANYVPAYVKAGIDILPGVRVLKGEVRACVKDQKENKNSQVSTYFKKFNVQQEFLSFNVIFFLLLLFSTIYIFSTKESYLESLSSLIVFLSMVILVDAILMFRFVLYKILVALFYRGVLVKGIKFYKDLVKIKKIKVLLKNDNQNYFLDDFQIFDEKIDPKKIMETIFYMLGNSSNEYFISLRKEILKRNINFLPNPVERLSSFEDGIIAWLDQQKIIFGTEDFIIKQGVFLNAGEMLHFEKSQMSFYLAINNEVIAGLSLAKSTQLNYKKLQQLFACYGKELDREQAVQVKNDLSFSKSIQKKTDSKSHPKTKEKCLDIVLNTNDLPNDKQVAVLVNGSLDNLDFLLSSCKKMSSFFNLNTFLLLIILAIIIYCAVINPYLALQLMVVFTFCLLYFVNCGVTS